MSRGVLGEWGEGDREAGASPEAAVDREGASFGEFVKGHPKMGLGDAFGEWIKQVGGRNSTDKRTGYDKLPDTDPSVTGKQGTNTSSTPLQPKINTPPQGQPKCYMTTAGWMCIP